MKEVVENLSPIKIVKAEVYSHEHDGKNDS